MTGQLIWLGGEQERFEPVQAADLIEERGEFGADLTDGPRSDLEIYGRIGCRGRRDWAGALGGVELVAKFDEACGQIGVTGAEVGEVAARVEGLAVQDRPAQLQQSQGPRR